MLLEIAIGDAYGAGFEYAEPTSDRPNDLSRYVRHPRHHGPRQGIGCYTDDTQMTIAVCETILAHGNPSARQFVERFVACFKRDERNGYARNFQRFLEEIADADAFEQRIRPDSQKSGAAMRVCPIGLYGSEDQVKQIAERQARTTHATPGGIQSAQAVALAVHYLRWRLGPRSGLARYVASHVPGRWEVPWAGKVGSAGMDSARAAITMVMAEHTLSSLLRRCIALRGDVDTAAAMALGMASCAVDMQQDLPDPLVWGLEDGVYGRRFLRDLDAQLEAFALAQGAPPR